jgi:hypothetical protein
MTGTAAAGLRIGMKNKSSRVLYFLLFVWGLISISYYIAGAAALREEWFYSATHARAPFVSRMMARRLRL